MSNPTQASAPTPMAAARMPDGWWLSHPRYRVYVLFAATGIVLAIAAAILMRGIAVLGEGASAWDAWLAALSNPIAIAINALFFVSIVFFAVRFLVLGPKVFSVPIGPLGALPPPVWLVLQGVPVLLVNALIVLVIWGVIL